MKRILIFGATGSVGLHVTELALKKGFQVRVLVRDINTLPENLRDKVHVIQGDVTKLSDVQKAVEGQDAVVVVLGTRTDLGPTTAMSDGMKNIVSAMEEKGLEHVSVCISAFLFYEPEKVPARFKDVTDDHRRMLDVLKASKGLKWVAILPPHFTDEPSSKYTVSHDSMPGRVIARCDLANFLLESLSTPEHYNQICGIANESA
ncbi:hypothetical protein L9F63_004985 [Diploptera punctata]|uniref:NAD(P)-binding domain-containing protein n=1 Tax=Diploptera punctata TaxID=6984 RepID=A0AAD7ZEN1_DIPPU|nr:hypothetical protein L9F63_004985 [Diploptera punctata]